MLGAVIKTANVCFQALGSVPPPFGSIGFYNIPLFSLEISTRFLFSNYAIVEFF